jgi:AraC family transcriptional regulator, regulatory protein of adaptative response / DNA-3-methyladenine glycosylase II
VVGVGGEPVVRRLEVRPPFDGAALLAFLARRAVPGVEEVTGATYRRSVALPHGAGTIALTPAAGHVETRLAPEDPRDLEAATRRARTLLDLDADPAAVAAALGDDPVVGALVRASPGRRVPGAADGQELAIRAVLGQQVSVAGARRTTAKIVRSFGEPLAAPHEDLTHRFPTMEALAAADPTSFAMPSARGRTVVTLAAALASGEVVLDPGADREEVSARLQALPGIGPWTADYIRLRALGDPDVFLPTDLGVRRALDEIGATVDDTHRWRPWRSYALHHLWSSLGPSPVRQPSLERTS